MVAEIFLQEAAECEGGWKGNFGGAQGEQPAGINGFDSTGEGRGSVGNKLAMHGHGKIVHDDNASLRCQGAE